MSAPDGVFGKARHTFRHVFYLGINTFLNIATKLSSESWSGPGLRLYEAQHKALIEYYFHSTGDPHLLLLPPHGIACSGVGDGGDDDSNIDSGGGDDDDNGGGGGDSDGNEHRHQTPIN